MFYNKAWTFDLSTAEKEAKRKLDRYGGLGYVDSKKAYRGLYTSGTLRFLLPYDDERQHSQGDDRVSKPRAGDSARDWFQTLVVCEVNERSEPSACHIGKDVTFQTGGVNATDITLLDAPGTLYLGKKICTNVQIPKDAKITSREAMLLEDPLLPSAQKRSLTRAIESNKTLIGMSLELSVHNHKIVAMDKACSLSHVVWEQRSPGGVRLPLPKPLPAKKHDKRKKKSSRPESSEQAAELKDPEEPKRPVDAALQTHKADSATEKGPHAKNRGDQAKPDPAKSAQHDKLRGAHGSLHAGAKALLD